MNNLDKKLSKKVIKMIFTIQNKNFLKNIFNFYKIFNINYYKIIIK